MLLILKNSIITKKRDLNDNSETNEPNRKSLKREDKSFKRAMTFNGAVSSSVGIKAVLHPPISDELFSQPEPIIPSFHESGKDMIRRISTSTVQEC
jgi:hypothetical protein